jgi:hypothetical protein
MKLTEKQLQMLRHADLVDMSHRARQKASALLNNPLIYGEFHGPHLSCEEDFRAAEWHPPHGDADG